MGQIIAFIAQRVLGRLLDPSLNMSSLVAPFPDSPDLVKFVLLAPCASPWHMSGTTVIMKEL